MRILLLTAMYSEKGGGVASVSRLLVRGLREREHEVVVLTSDEGGEATEESVILNPSIIRLIMYIIRADAVILQGCILRLAWPLFFIRRNAVMVRHMLDPHKSFIRSRLTRCIRLATVSAFMASKEASKCTVLPNPYDSRMFYNKVKPRVKDLIFVSRLIPKKGAMQLLRAFLRLQELGDFTLTIIGEGEELPAYESFILRHKLSEKVFLLGHQSAFEIAEQMRQHKIFVMSSMLEEAFGLVVLEGLACGCFVIAANRGGIPEALGGMGALYDVFDENALYEQIKKNLLHADIISTIDVENHLQHYRPEAVARVYESFLLGVSD